MQSRITQEKKIYTIGYISLVGLSIIIARLIYLQIGLNSYFYIKSTNNFLRKETIISPRGNITDRYGNLLATNRPVIHIYWQGTGNKRLSPDQESLLKTLNSLTHHHDFSFHYHLNTSVIQAEKSYTTTLLVEDADINIISAIQEYFPNHQNIYLKHDFKRFYPHHISASHLIGYLNEETNNQKKGSMGLEYLFNNELKGNYGTLLKTINSIGRKLDEELLAPAQIGNEIRTTIDLSLQHICEDVFSDDLTGTFIIMDPENGDLLTLLSRPTFDPNMFLKKISPEDWRSIQENRPFLNRAINATYPPGSIFKLITVSAALEHNIITTDSLCYCKGFVLFGERNYWCQCRHGHGLISVTQAVAKSCNTLCFNIAKELDIDILASYAHTFGLGSPTGIIFSEKSGLVPDKKWKKTTLNERWYRGETLSVSIGQSYMLVTPLQIACMISSIFTGQLPKPRILINEKIYHRPLDIKEETLHLLQQSMKMVVETGTGKQVNASKDFQIFAKTSTAQTSNLEKRNLGKEYMEHGWFVAYVQYKNLKPITIVILIEHAGTSKIPTAIAKKFLIKYKKMIHDKEHSH